jgi:hypothetical protein
MDTKTQQQYAETFHNLHRKGGATHPVQRLGRRHRQGHREDFSGRSDQQRAIRAWFR